MFIWQVKVSGNKEKQVAVKSERNELVRKILQICGPCSHGQGKGRGLICDRKKSLCYSKRVSKWLKEIEKLERKEER